MKISSGMGASLPPIEPRHKEYIEGELTRVKNALPKVDADLQAHEAETLKKIGRAEVEVFAAHRMILADPSFSCSRIEANVLVEPALQKEAAEAVLAFPREHAKNQTEIE